MFNYEAIVNHFFTQTECKYMDINITVQIRYYSEKKVKLAGKVVPLGHEI